MVGAADPFSRTTVIGRGEDAPDAGVDDDVLALVIAWSREEPHRAGEIAIVAKGAPRAILGRGWGEDPLEPRVRFFRQRPAVVEETPPLASAGISRRQLVIEAAAGGVRVERVGQCVVEVNGARTEGGILATGDVLHLQRELVLLCTRRAALIPEPRLFPKTSAGPFGEADALGMIGESPSSWRLREAISFAAQANTHVLVLGDSGTGKELVARGVHALSSRAGCPFVARNAATLPAALVDAELFGNAKNYPNAGMPERAGLVGQADGGTLFLDEIGELSAELQAHLLRVLDSDGEYQRLGEATTRRSSFRLVAATNRNPNVLKPDFLARLQCRIDVAPLARRREDIPLLVRHLLARAAEQSPAVVGRFLTPNARVDPALVEYLLRRDYTANVREVESILWQSMSESTGDIVELPRSLKPPPVEQTPRMPRPRTPTPTAEAVREAIGASGGNVVEAARVLGVSSRFVLYRLMKRYGIDVDER
jgi:two-component system nitrogen regulation response regulator GlnG/two-component system response regulator HydG